MVHLGDWIYFHADVDDYSDNTIFRYGESGNLLPKGSSNPIYALFDDGDMNVKNSVFEVYIVLKKWLDSYYPRAVYYPCLDLPERSEFTKALCLPRTDTGGFPSAYIR